MSFIPSYLKLYEEGGLRERIDALNEMLKSCILCPHECRVDRTAGETGICGASAEIEVSSVSSHFGEESPLVGTHGSGTIFLTHCSLKCVFCQNYDISHLGDGRLVTHEEFAQMMIHLQERGCHNINFVTPTHYTAQIIAALPYAIEKGLKIPLVYNCGGYESVRILKLLDGIIDIYMPDAKFSQSETAARYTQAENYTEALKNALKEMHRQVGGLVVNSSGIAEKGLLIRHLVMPFDLAGTKELMKFVAEKISPDSFVNVMAQYHPCHLAYNYDELKRRISTDEYLDAKNAAREAGLKRAGTF